MERQTGFEPACYSFAESCLTTQRHWRINWRKERDSNPRTRKRIGSLVNSCFKPLSHPS